jgi:hypothetical protein
MKKLTMSKPKKYEDGTKGAKVKKKASEMTDQELADRRAQAISERSKPLKGEVYKNSRNTDAAQRKGYADLDKEISELNAEGRKRKGTSLPGDKE